MADMLADWLIVYTMLMACITNGVQWLCLNVLSMVAIQSLLNDDGDDASIRFFHLSLSSTFRVACPLDRRMKRACITLHCIAFHRCALN